MASTPIEKSDVELIHDLLAAERQLVSARMRHSANQLENTAELGVLRRSIARMHTVARQRERAQGLPKDSLLSLHRQTFAATSGAEVGESVAKKGGFLSGIVDKLAGQE